MAWSALIIMAIVTVVILIWPDRIKSAESIIMMMYGSLSALVGAYFGFANIGKKEMKGLYANIHAKRKENCKWFKRKDAQTWH